MTLNFLSLEGSYQDFELALFRGQECITLQRYERFNASANLIPSLDSMLKSCKVSLSNINFIALDQGPGAFTSLRATITTVNAISFASNIPLIGIDGLDALAETTLQTHQKLLAQQKPPYIMIALLNAFNKEVFFAINRVENNNLTLLGPKGYEKIQALLARLATKYKNHLFLFSGNGSLLYQKEIMEKFGKQACIPSPLCSVASAKQIGLMALVSFVKDEKLTNEIVPLYLKTQHFKPKYQ